MKRYLVDWQVTAKPRILDANSNLSANDDILWRDELVTGIRQANLPSYPYAMSSPDVQKEIAGAPDGGHGMAYSCSGINGIRVLVAETYARVAKYIPPQNPMSDASTYFNHGMTNRFGCWRMDDGPLLIDVTLLDEIAGRKEDETVVDLIAACRTVHEKLGKECWINNITDIEDRWVIGYTNDVVNIGIVNKTRHPTKEPKVTPAWHGR